MAGRSVGVWSPAGYAWGWRSHRSGGGLPAASGSGGSICAGAGLDATCRTEAPPHRSSRQHLLQVAGAEARSPFIDIEKAFEQDPPPIGLSLDDLTWKDRLDVWPASSGARCELACPRGRARHSRRCCWSDLCNQLLKGRAALRSRQAGTRRWLMRRAILTATRGRLTKVAPARPPLGCADGAASAHAQLVGDVIRCRPLGLHDPRACMEACPGHDRARAEDHRHARHPVLVESRRADPSGCSTT